MGIGRGIIALGLFTAVALPISGCSTFEQAGRDFKTAIGGGKETPGSSTASPPPPGAATAPESKRQPPGMNANGEVINSKEVEAGHGQQVKGLGDWEGEITGKPAPGSRFTRLQIGMPLKQVTDLIGEPTDQGAYVTGKAWIPFYFGSDRYRFELVYKGQGRLIFAGGGPGNFSSGNLTWIIHNGLEQGYR